jgi:hypothetical protein
VQGKSILFQSSFPPRFVIPTREESHKEFYMKLIPLFIPSLFAKAVFSKPPQVPIAIGTSGRFGSARKKQL